MKRLNMVRSDFFCMECGNKGIPLPRSQSRQREYGHIKDLYCCKCKKITKHRELRNIDWLAAAGPFYDQMNEKERVYI